MSDDLIKEKMDNHEKRIEALENNTSDFKTVVYRLDLLEKTITTMNIKLDLALSKEASAKSEKWDKLIEYIFYSVLAILLGYIAYNLGIQN